MKYRIIISLLCLAGWMVLGGCTEPNSSGDSGNVKISVRGSSRNSPQGIMILAKRGSTVDSVTITQAQIVIDRIEFENSNEDSMDFELDMPFVQDLVGDSMYVIAVVDLPIGIYEEMEIEIDELKAEDGAVYMQNPNLQDLSIYVTGYVNGDTTQKFIFVSDLSEEQEKEFDPPLVIDAASPDTNVVLTIDTSMWFVDDGGNFIDPRLPGNQRVIEKNIKKSIEMYEDENDDGEDDDGD